MTRKTTPPARRGGAAPEAPPPDEPVGALAPPAPPARAWPTSRLKQFSGALRAPDPAGAPTLLNRQSIESVQAINAETAAYATTQIAVGPNMMITQAGGMVAQAAANYFEASASLAIAGKSVLMKDLAQKTIDEDAGGMAMDAMGLLLTDLFVATAAMVAGAAEAIEGEAASIALDKIDQSLQKYQALLDKKGA